MKALPQRKTRNPLTSAAFDARSVMLFAALTLGGAGALQAQASKPLPPQFGPAASSAPQPAAAPHTTPGTTPVTTPLSTAAATAAASAAFARADTNQDGQLSPQETAHLPAIAQRFKELDTDQNGSLSRAEFDKGAEKS